MIHVNQYRIEVVVNQEKLKEVENLVYLKYKEKKFCSNRFEVHHSLMKKNKITLGIYEEDELCATLTLVFDLHEKLLPSEHLYLDELTSMRSQGHKIVEITKLSSKTGKEEALYLLFILSFLFTQKVLYTDMVAMIEPRHLLYYKSKFNFTTIGQEKLDFKAENAKSLLIHLDVVNIVKSILFSKSKRGFRLLETIMNPMFILQLKEFVIQALNILDLENELVLT